MRNLNTKKIFLSLILVFLLTLPMTAQALTMTFDLNEGKALTPIHVDRTDTQSNAVAIQEKICVGGTCKYTLLAPIGNLIGVDGIYTTTQSANGLCSLFNSWFRIGIALAGLFAVIMIVLGGIEYATTDSLFNKSEGKSKVENAVFGLLLALTTWLIINTINPALTNCNLQATSVELDALTITEQQAIRTAISNGVLTTGSDGQATPLNTVADGTAFNPNLTAYSPQGGGANGNATMEGGYESSRPGLDGKSVVHTLDDVSSGASNYVTLAGDPSQYGQTYVIPSITYTNSAGQTKTLTNVTGYVHDTGSAFTGAGASHFDIATGKDYSTGSLNNQQFSGNSTSIVKGKITPK